MLHVKVYKRFEISFEFPSLYVHDSRLIINKRIVRRISAKDFYHIFSFILLNVFVGMKLLQALFQKIILKIDNKKKEKQKEHLMKL